MHPTQFASKDLKNRPSLLGMYHRKRLKPLKNYPTNACFVWDSVTKLDIKLNLLRCVLSSKIYIFSGLVKEQQVKWSP